MYTELLHMTTFHLLGPVIVKCCQTGKKLTVKVKDLSREDSQSLTVHDLTNGASLILNHKEKFYPVQFLEYKG